MDINYYIERNLQGQAGSPLEALAEIVARGLYVHPVHTPTQPGLKVIDATEFKEVGVISARDEANKSMYFYFEKGDSAPSGYTLPAFDDGNLMCRNVIWDREVAARHWLDLCDPDAAIEVGRDVFEQVSRDMSKELRKRVAAMHADQKKKRRPHPSQPHIELINTVTPINQLERRGAR